VAKGYWVSAYPQVHDEKKLTAYLELAAPAIIAAGGKFITRGMAVKVCGFSIIQRTKLIEFESLIVALVAHDMPAYQAALKALDAAVTLGL
jgi:uncharacterized protein (DUF1330 family)